MAGAIQGVGPRYCPSIEDKVVRFADRERHQIFLEPEGLDDDTVYPNGISTSLPEAVQAALIASIPGLERRPDPAARLCDRIRPCRPAGAAPTLEVRAVPRLFLAGQINGTTGYEEAAAQGLMAGINAAAARRRTAAPDRVLIGRAEAYIGVLVDDLVLQGVTEPYRMLTARAEHRLALRADNAGLRLTETGIAWGCVGPERAAAHRAFAAAIERCAGPRTAGERDAGRACRGRHRRKPGWPPADSASRCWACPASTAAGDRPRFSPGCATSRPAYCAAAGAEALYAPYLAGRKPSCGLLEREERLAIPDDLDFAAVPGLSLEMRQRLSAARPATLGGAGRIPGITPAAIAALAVHLRNDAQARFT